MSEKLQSLQPLLKIKRKDRVHHLPYVPEEQLHNICKGCMNLISGNIELNSSKKHRIKRQLNPIKSEIRKLADSKVTSKAKRRIPAKPQVGEGVFTILASAIIPALIAALSK